jgi:tetratricopeptide (TPR) repeat protein
MGFIRGYDRDTLRELVDLDECADRLAEIENQRSLPALLERVWLLKVLGRLDDALALADETVRQARMAGTRKDVLRARVLHATVLQYRGAHAAAEQELATCADEAEGQRWLSIAAFAHQHHGKNAYEAGDYETARESFKRSLFLRREAGAQDSELETALLAIEAVERRRGSQLIAG